MTLAEALEAVIELRSPGWKDGGRSAGNWRRSFESYILPTLGDRPVGDVTPADLLGVLAPLAHSRPETCRKLRTRVGVVDPLERRSGPTGVRRSDAQPSRQRCRATVDTKWSTTWRYRPPRSPRPWRRSTPPALGWRHVSRSGSSTLSATRSGEVRGARMGRDRHDERGSGRCQRTRSKTGRPHRIPLSAQALAVLERGRGAAR